MKLNLSVDYASSCNYTVPARVMRCFYQFSILPLQLVQFLLKQAGVDRRTGDLFGNRDFLNIARNMARGLKVCFREINLLTFEFLVFYHRICLWVLMDVFLTDVIGC